MATYSEIAAIHSDAGFTAFLDRVSVAVIIKAKAIADMTTPTTAALDWAKTALNSPRSMAGSIVHYVIAANNSASISAMLGASDSTLQTNVDAAVDTLYGV